MTTEQRKPHFTLTMINDAARHAWFVAECECGAEFDIAPEIGAYPCPSCQRAAVEVGYGPTGIPTLSTRALPQE